MNNNAGYDISNGVALWASVEQLPGVAQIRITYFARQVRISKRDNNISRILFYPNYIVKTATNLVPKTFPLK